MVVVAAPALVVVVVSGMVVIIGMVMVDISQSGSGLGHQSSQ